MSSAPTFPGFYIEELPSSVHTVLAAPTRTADFVDYTHPFQTDFGTPVQLLTTRD